MRAREVAGLFEHENYVLTWVTHRSGSRPQKGIVTYGLSPNRQNAFAGAAHDAVFNTWRRFSGQVLYWAPPLVVAYYIMDWATAKYDLPLSLA